MLKVLRSRLTYANVMATVAVFLALGGGAYALTGIPDRSGVYHGCVDGKTSVLRVVRAAGSCRKAKTVRRGKRRIRIPGESAIAWNQQGLQGLRGSPGVQGLQGVQGLPGPVFGAVAHSQGAVDPTATPNEPSPPSGRHFAFALPAAGNVYLHYFSSFFGVSCSVGPAHAGLYLDGVPLPQTGDTEPSAGAGAPTEIVAVAAAATGAHVAEIRADCPNGSVSSTVDNASNKWTVLLLGA